MNETQPAIVSSEQGMTKYLSPLAAWALAFGCAVGWGSFAMPGNTFLPVAGPLGAALGLFLGAGIMLIIGVNYAYLMRRYPDAGGVYTFSKRVLGSDHGFLCAWMLILTYIAIIWANSTALSLIMRQAFGEAFCFGFSYEIAGYTVYLGEVLLSVAVLALTCAVCVLSKRLTAWVQIICALILFVGVAVCFVCVTVHGGGFEAMQPAFSETLDAKDPAVQVLGVVVLAPWAFVGFESISHSVPEFRFSKKKSLPIMAAALLTGALTYVMLTLCASLARPDGYGSWTEYIGALIRGEAGGFPTFRSAEEAMGPAGLYLLLICAVCGIVTGLIANYVALSRLFHALSRDNMIHPRVGALSRRGIPARAMMIVAAVSCVMPLLGRTAIGWIVDVTTVGASIIFAYVSIDAFVTARREKRRGVMVTGVAGAVAALLFNIVYLFPIFSVGALSAESFLILIIWSLAGMVLFSVLMRRDKTRSHGKSEIVWLVLIILILMVSALWIYQVIDVEATRVVQAADVEVDSLVFGFRNRIVKLLLVHTVMVLTALGVIYSVFSTMRKREKYIEAERILAEENSRAKATFLSNMSHDIRTPMNAVTGYTALALREKDISDTLRGYLENIDISGKHMLSIINDILDMSRIDSGKMELETAPEDLCAIFEEARSIFRHQMEVKGLTFSIDYSGVTDRYVICDKNRLNRILLNLISNACKFTPDGGRVSVSMVQTGRTEDGGDYQLSVADTGIGMSPEFAEKIFEAFERERNSTVSDIQGTGLGMSITKKLVGMMNGEISVTTAQGKGTRFDILLRFPIAGEADAADNSGESRSFEGVRLLLAEDNPINREIAVMLLTHEGFAVDTACDGSEAVDKVTAAPDGAYDAILMDVQMPVMSGYEATRAIRSLGGAKGSIPIIAMTANTFKEDIDAALTAGMQAHIAKPLDLDKMMATLTEVLGK